ncbi:MAG: DNA polymerase III subunit delta [Planctomycetota bacterium]
MSFNNKTVQNEFQELAARPVIAIVGTDRFLLRQALERLLQEASRDRGVDPVWLDGRSATPAEVLDEVRTPSLLGDRRMVIVDDADELIEGNRKTLERYCSDPAAEGCLVLLCRSLPRNTNLYKVIAKLGGFMQVEPPAGRDIVPWIVRRASEVHGKRMNHAAAERLQEHIGDAPGLLDAELGKLATYAGGRDEITAKDVDEVCGNLREEKVFGLVDAIGAGDAATAIQLWRQALATDKAAEHKAIGGLAYAVGELLKACRLRDRGRSVATMQGEVRVPAWVLSRQLGWASTSRMQRMQRDLLEADVAIKTGLSSPAIAIEKFILNNVAATGLRARTG